jgi:hypothetical protein
MELSRENLAKILPKDAVDTIFGLFERTRRAATGTEPQKSTPPTVIVGTSGPRTVAWDNVVDKPGSFPPSGHSHPYISVETDPTVPVVVKTITKEDIERWNNPPRQIIEIASCLEPNWVIDMAQDMWDRVESPLCFRWDVMVEEYSTLEHIVSDFVAGSSAVGRMAIWGHKEYGIADTTKLLDVPLFDGHKSSFSPINITPYIWLTICMDPGVSGAPNPIGQHHIYPGTTAHLQYCYLVEHVHGEPFGVDYPPRYFGGPPFEGVIRWMKLGVR